MIPKLSIIIPCFEVEKYLDRCMNTVVNQTLIDIEIILVDDGSTDKVPQMCDEWAEKDSRIKVIHKKNEGLGYARNAGLDIATGEYVAFVDSDDFISLDMYETLYKKAMVNHLDVVYCGFYEYQAEKIVKVRSEVDKYTEFNGQQCHEVLHGMLSPCGEKGKITRFEMSVWHSIYRKSIFDAYNIQFCSERNFISEDIIFHIDYIKHCNKIGFIPDSFYYYCLNENSLSKSYNEDRFNKVDILCEEVWNRVIRNNYSFPVDDCIYFICLSLRYPITILKQYDFTYTQKKVILSKMIESNLMNKWINRIKWRKLPFRYVIFFLLVKYKLVNLLMIYIR